ncbi:MAG: hypothetical protein IJW88_03130 [Alistipes sp.]|nr:hypothetical protein [Alistipes sp.]
MKYLDEVVTSLKELAGDVNYFAIVNWWQCVYKGHHIVYKPNTDNQTIRMCLLFYHRADSFDYQTLVTAINQTNREVRYIKAVILRNGCISINYDYRYDDRCDINAIIKHILEALYFAAEYLQDKLVKNISKRQVTS